MKPGMQKTIDDLAERQKLTPGDRADLAADAEKASTSGAALRELQASLSKPGGRSESLRGALLVIVAGLEAERAGETGVWETPSQPSRDEQGRFEREEARQRIAAAEESGDKVLATRIRESIAEQDSEDAAEAKAIAERSAAGA